MWLSVPKFPRKISKVSHIRKNIFACSLKGNFQLLHSQSAFFDFCAGNRHQIVAGARVKAVKETPKLLVARVEVANVAQLLGLSCKCGTNYTLYCGMARVRVESDKTVPKIRLSPKFGACMGGNSENCAGNIFPAHYKECSFIPSSLKKILMFPCSL